MRFLTLSVLSLLSIASAQTTTLAVPSATPSSSGCQAQNIVDACRKTIQGQIDSCKDNDWICLCEQYTNLLTCYNNCPESNERPPVQNQVTSFCNAAAPLKSSSSAEAATKTPSSSGSQSTLATSGSPTSTGSSATGFGNVESSSPTSTGAAIANFAPGVGGVMAVVLGLAGMM